jgi:cytochrome c2
MAHAGFTWNTASLRQYLTDPQAKVKGSCPKPRHCAFSRSD